MKKTKKINRATKFHLLSPKFILLLFLLLLILISGYYFNSKKQVAENLFITTYDECSQLSDSTITQTYPRQCEIKDGTEFIEVIKEPVNTSNWKTIKTDEGILFKCPPDWSCSSTENAIIITQGTQLVGNLYIILVTSQNFQQSLIRHPNYTNPISWLTDVRTQKQTAITTYDSAIMSSPGTDGSGYPIYHNSNFMNISSFDIKHKEATVISNNSSYLIIPFSETAVLVVYSSPDTVYKNPIMKAIIDSVTSK